MCWGNLLIYQEAIDSQTPKKSKKKTKGCGMVNKARGVGVGGGGVGSRFFQGVFVARSFARSYVCYFLNTFHHFYRKKWRRSPQHTVHGQASHKGTGARTKKKKKNAKRHPPEEHREPQA